MEQGIGALSAAGTSMEGVAWAVVPDRDPSERIGWIERRATFFMESVLGGSWTILLAPTSLWRP